MNPTTTDREGRIKQKLDEKLQILNSPMNHIHTEHLLDVVNEIVVAELKEERQRTLNETANKIVDAFGGMVPMSGEDAMNPHAVAQMIKEMVFPHIKAETLKLAQDAMEEERLGKYGSRERAFFGTVAVRLHAESFNAGIDAALTALADITSKEGEK